MRLRILLLLPLLLPVLAVADTAPLPSLLAEAARAASGYERARVAEVNQAITELRAVMPDWVASRLAAASAIGEADADAVEAISAMTAEVHDALAGHQFDDALATQESVLLVAQETFGEKHWLTIAALRDFGYAYRQAGAAGEAQTFYSLALSAAEEALGTEHPQTIEIVSLLGELYTAAGMAQDAVSTREMAVASATAGLGADHPVTVGARLALVQTLKQFGQYDAAIAESVDLCGDIEGAYGRFHTYSLKCQETVADIEFTTGKLGEAEKTLLLIADLIGRSLPTVDGQWLGNLAELAELYRQQGRYQESKDLLSSTIGLALQTGNVESSYLGKSYLGRVLADEGDYQHAATVTKEVLDYRIANAATDPVSIYNTLLVLGAIYQAQGKLGDAESSFKEAYEGLVQAVGEDNPSTLVATNNLGQIYEQIGLYDQAEPMLKTALERLERVLGPTHPDTIRARNNLALLHESQGNFREAEPLYQLSLDQMTAVHGENYTDTVAVQNNLAYLYMLMEDYDGAVTMFEQVLQKWTTIFGPEHQNTLKALNNLARAYQKLGRLAEAEPRFLSAYQTRAAVLGQDHLDTIRSMIDLGGLYLEQGRLGEANDLLTAALDRAERILTEQHPYTFDALNMLARVKRAQGATQAALDLMEKGMQRRSVFLDRMLWTTGENAREGYLRLFRPELNEYLSLIAEAPNADSGRRAIEASLQRKGLLLKVTSEIQQIAGLSLDPTLTQLAERLRAARKALASLTLSGPTPETQGRHVEALYELEQQVNELQGELGRASVRFRTSIAQMNTAKLESVMADDSALVDFLAYEDGDVQKVLAGVLIKEHGKARYELVVYADRKQVDDAVINYRTLIQDDQADEDEIQEAGVAADDIIWDPVRAAIGDITDVYLVPDGVLNILPFNALVGDDHKYLIQLVDLHILTSARDLLPNPYELSSGAYIILAGPDYDSEDVVSEEQIAEARGRRSSVMQLGIRGAGSGLRGLSFAPLPGAEKEGRIITDEVEQKNEPNVVYFGGDAQEQVLSALTKPPQILHMATHGFFLAADENLRKRLLKLQRGADLHIPPPGDNPLLRAGLAFAGINNNAQFLGDIDTDNDGVLTALEVLDLDLSGTQLVVLSACETGLGEIYEGEGVYGLRRSFQEAGVAEVISSLWEVSDAGTQALMTSFYRRLLDGMPAREALRDAQLELMGSPEWGYPYIWSAFMIVGSYESSGFKVN